MDAKIVGYLVCLLIMAMDITAGILGIQAEIAQNKVKNLRVWIFECRDPSYEAFKLGLAATVLLSLAHVIANMLSGCTCIWSREELDRSTNNKQLAAASLVHRLLSIGGILCFIHGLFAVAYYISATAAIQEDKKLNQPTVGAPA